MVTGLDASAIPSREGRATVSVRERTAQIVRGAMEAILLGTLVVSPWLFGAVEPPAEASVYALVAVLLILWGALAVLEGAFRWQNCGLFMCLCGLFLLGILQQQPLSREWLRRLSPATADYFERLLPAQQESIDDVGGDDAAPTVGSSLSFYPSATQRQTLRLLVIILVFALVRGNLVGVPQLQRLSVAVVMNGALLSTFAIAQALSSSSRHLLFWTWSLPGASVFGPFICHNHFPFYVNIAFGLGVGLLMCLGAAKGESSEARERGGLQRLLGFVQHPAAPWLVLALGLCLVGTVFSLSRGGCLALLAAVTIVCGARWVNAASNKYQMGALAAAIVFAIIVAFGFGYDAISARMATMLGGEALDDPRVPMWLRGLAVARAFPTFGTGLGTFQYVEGLHRTEGSEAHIYYDAAHNDYLEALVEGGVPGLFLALLAVFFVGRYAVHAVQRYRSRVDEGLVWGLLLGLGTMLIHSFVDFGLHVPAITLLATVLIAHLSALGTETGMSVVDSEPLARTTTRHAAGLVPYVAALTLAALGLVLCGNAWTMYVIHRLSEGARTLEDRTDLASLLQQVIYLDRAVLLRPDSNPLQVRRARAHAAIYQHTMLEVEQMDQLCGRANITLTCATAPGSAGLIAAIAGEMLRHTAFVHEDKEVGRDHLAIALRAYQRARNSCPLVEEPNRALALFGDSLKSGDSRAAYLARAKFLSPGIPLVWFEAGLQELDEHHPDQALVSWRRCLELDRSKNKFITRILDKAKNAFAPQAIARELVPDDPEQLLRAVQRLYPADPDDPAEQSARQTLLTRAVQELDKLQEPVPIAILALKSSAYRYLGRYDEAAEVSRRAVERDPSQVEFRLQLAQYLFERGRLQEARRELLAIESAGTRVGAPYYEAQTLLKEVRKQLAEGSK